MRRLLTGFFVILCFVIVAIMTAEPSSAAFTALTRTPLPTVTPEPETEKPLVVLTIYEPFQMVIGSDAPTFALYDSGQVIYASRNSQGLYDWFTVTLNEEELESLLDDLNIGEEFYNFEDSYDELIITDQPMNVITVWDEERGEKSVSVYGSLKSNTTHDARDLTPQAFLDLYDQLVDFEHPDAEVWTPEFIEVVVWEYHHASDPALWPETWPDLDDPTTVKRDMVYSIYVPYEELDAFRELVQGADSILIDGKKWTYSLRYPYPHETE